MQIECLLIFNKTAKVRLRRWYTTEGVYHGIDEDIVKAVLCKDHKEVEIVQLSSKKTVVYRQFAGLFFAVVVPTEPMNDCALYEFLNLVVISLDEYFENVCDLDLIFFPFEALAVIEEMIGGGLLLETSPEVICNNLTTLQKSNKAAVT
eukprot:GHVH01006880.1.p1 GENE.GHVH01006880.1~~GHVH01006880.1.p1  ORF type:complete len:149 (+),score=24.07 GHVH01006880.1:44-490(+)